MNSRERFLAVVLIVAMAVVSGGFLGYQFILRPLRDNTDKQSKLREEVDALDTKKREIEIEQAFYETRTRKKSLPLDVTFAQREYERMVDRMLRQAKFTAPVITPHPADSKSNVPMLAGKKPIYTKLDFDVQVKGDLLELVDFLYAFYRQPLLHQIRKIDITKVTRGRSDGPDRDLEIKLTIEALVLDRAEDRRQLLYNVPSIVFMAGGAAASSFATANVESGIGTPFTAAGVLARGDDLYSKTSSEYEYHRIAGKNIFFDPLRPELKVADDRTKETDLGPNVCLDCISHSDGKSSALVYDRFNHNDYEIEMNQRGQVKVTQYSRKRVEKEDGEVEMVRVKNKERPFLQFGSEEGGNLRKYIVQRIMEDELLLEPFDSEHERLMNGPVSLALGGTGRCVFPGRLCVWRVGQMLANDDPKKAMRELTYGWNKQHLMLRPLDVINEGDGTITFSGDGDTPVEPLKPTTEKKFDFKGGSFRKKGKPGQ